MIVCLTRFVLRSSSAGQGILFIVDLMILSFQSSPYVLCSLPGQSEDRRFRVFSGIFRHTGFSHIRNSAEKVADILTLAAPDKAQNVRFFSR